MLLYAWKAGMIGPSSLILSASLHERLHGDSIDLPSPEEKKIATTIDVSSKESSKIPSAAVSSSVATELADLEKVDISNTSREYVASMDNSDIHVIFSTDCNAFQDWQSLLLFHSAHQVGQIGPVTRIASGCNEEQKLQLKRLYRKLWPQYGVHFTPDYKSDPKTGRKYDFYNKPYGLKHFLEHSEPPLKDEVVLALIDPDQLFLRPLTTKMKDADNNIISKPWNIEDIFDKVETGRPAGQTYGLGAPWVNDNHRKFNRGKKF